MPSKIVFETEDLVMEEIVDTAADVKTLKVRRVSRVAGNLTRNVSAALRQCPDRPMLTCGSKC